MIILKKFFSNHDFFCKSLINRKEPEPQFEISAAAATPDPGGNLISAPRLSAPRPQH